MIEGPSHGSRQIKRKVENVIGQTAGFACKLLTCRRGCGKNQGAIGILHAQAAAQFLNGFHFAHGDGMDPDTALQFGDFKIAEPRFHRADVFPGPEEIPGGRNEKSQE